MNKFKLLVALLFSVSALSGQDYPELLRQNAVEIQKPDSLNEAVYQVVKDFEIIMVGEMHGTLEPAMFVEGLAKLISKKEGIVCVALEIPDEDMLGYMENKNEENLRETYFFSSENTDGRNGEAWFNLINKLDDDAKIKLFFIDNEITSNRDSSMYLEVLKIRKLYPDSKIITLTGNIHNWLIPFREEKRIGALLVENDVVNPDKIMSVNHMFNSGTMMNNFGNGLELKTIEPYESFLNNTLDFDKYLCPIIFENQEQYNYFFYTDKVTHSNVLTH
jgi:hypothetical protein